MVFFDRKKFMFFPMEHIMLPAHERCQRLADLTEEAFPSSLGQDEGHLAGIPWALGDVL